MHTKQEFSYGIIPLCLINGEHKTLLVKHQKGHWAFSKGHQEALENPRQTAQRELAEETGLKVEKFLEIAPLKEHYSFQLNETLIQKTVTYFVAHISGKVTLQVEEIADYRWLTLHEAEKLATFPETKQLCKNLLKDPAFHSQG